eukprot:m.116724 g.116724  ORF g.116724 m.116724 type:complete len:231 (+) comp28531_c0_seq1:254-946(+)
MSTTTSNINRFNQAKYTGENGGPAMWAKNLDVIIFDFDRTITRKHTNGCVLLPAHAKDEYIENNFADLEFFRWVVPQIIKKGLIPCIASFGEDVKDSFLSGVPLVRKYLDHAFGPNSKDLIPNDLIAMWHPESRKEDHKKVGKSHHIEFLVTRVTQRTKGMAAKRLSYSKVALFDDDEVNIKLAQRQGVNAFHCPAVSARDEASASGLHKLIWERFVSDKGKTQMGCVLM